MGWYPSPCWSLSGAWLHSVCFESPHWRLCSAFLLVRETVFWTQSWQKGACSCRWMSRSLGIHYYSAPNSSVSKTQDYLSVVDSYYLVVVSQICLALSVAGPSSWEQPTESNSYLSDWNAFRRLWALAVRSVWNHCRHFILIFCRNSCCIHRLGHPTRALSRARWWNHSTTPSWMTLWRGCLSGTFSSWSWTQSAPWASSSRHSLLEGIAWISQISRYRNLCHTAPPRHLRWIVRCYQRV